MKGVGKVRVKLSVPVPKGPRSPKPQASHPRFKRPKMSTMGKSAYGTGKQKIAFPNGAAAMLAGGAPMGAGADVAGGAPMPPTAQPDNIGGM